MKTLLKMTLATAISGVLYNLPTFADTHELIDRVRPVGQLVIRDAATAPAAEPEAASASAAPAATEAPAEPAAASTPSESATAATAFDVQATYQATCFACHGTGAAGAPKLGDAAAWDPRIAQGMDALYTSAINGKGAMPPKGAAMHLSDDQIKAVVDFIVSQVR